MSSSGYPSGHIPGATKSTRVKKNIQLHELIIRRARGDRPVGMVIDHINRNVLDCTRANLRWVTPKQNSWNAGPRKGCKYKGICQRNKYKYPNKWRALAYFNGNREWIGEFDTPEAAALAYDKVAFARVGSRAYLNFPEKLNA